MKHILLVLCCFSFIYGFSQDSLRPIVSISLAEIEYKPGHGHFVQKIELDSVFIPLSIGQALDQKTSLYINQQGGNGIQTLNLRGMGSGHSPIYWNGFNINSPTLGLSDASLIHSGIAQEIEIHHGLSSLFDGSGGLGGSLQMTNSFGQQFISLTAGYSSLNNYQLGLQQHFKGKKTAFFYNVFYHEGEREFDFYNSINKKQDTLCNTDFEHLSINVGLEQKLNERYDLEVLYWFNQLDRNLGHNISNELQDFDSQWDEQHRAIVSFKRKGNNSIWELKNFLSDEDQKFFYGLESRTQVRSIQNQVRAKIYLGNRWKLIAVAESKWYEATSDGFPKGQKEFRPSIMMNPSFGLNSKTRLDLIVRAEMNNEVVAPLAPNLSINHQINDKIDIKASIASAYKFPTFNELYWLPGGNPDLKAERGHSYDLGLESTLFENSKSLIETEVEVFQGKIKDWILWVPGESFWTAQNVHQIKNRGFTMQIRAQRKWSNQLMSQVKLSASWTETINDNDAPEYEEEFGKQLIYTPRMMMNSSMNLQWKKWVFNYQIKYTDKRFIQTDHSRFMPAFTLHNCALHWSFDIRNKNNIYMGIRVNNLSDLSYQVVAHQPMPGRNFNLEIKYKFK